MKAAVRAKLQAALDAISACNASGATRRYGEAIDKEWKVRQEVEDARHAFDLAGRQLRRMVRRRFDVVVGRIYYREVDIDQHYAIDHSTRPPTIRPHLIIRAYARGGAGKVERTLWPTHPQHIEQALRQIKNALIMLEQEPVADAK